MAAVRPTKLFIGGLSQNTTTKVLRTHFSEFGRVLDCVAMFNQDGRSRSFGYVTLDSVAAAERCVADPQVIDGRVVDVKLAVPEKEAGKKAPTTRARRATDTPTPTRAAKTSLSPSAPAFVPVDAGCPGMEEDNFLLNDEDYMDVEDDVEDDMQMLTQLEEDAQDDSVNSLEAMAQRLAEAGVGAPPGLTPITGLPMNRPPPPMVPPPPAPWSDEEGKESKNSDDGDSSTVAPSSTVSPAVSQVQLEESDSDEAADSSEPLVSLGAALHASGNCRPCNFFGKGRCQNGTECEFCHMPHQKRKPTRQEKRERAAAWLERQKFKVQEDFEAAAQERLEKAAAAVSNQPQQVKPVMQNIGSLVPTGVPGLMFNFDCYSDDSDDESVVVSPNKAASVDAEQTPVADVREDERVWSREHLLAMKSAMEVMGGVSDGMRIKSVAVC
eukprot:TRINITY_DN1384_c0_g2_i1.p1 TRINITY_DN1384_c0_g2~~TRINITY_DN1384_c0_g2_i1.p1  ORF type:complete len:440 (-),score=132.36 TRINITY_DN1384_c0_g2_i1:179-1498(-)